jgi:hypothetical protein
MVTLARRHVGILALMRVRIADITTLWRVYRGGGGLVVDGEASPSVQRHLADLALVPDALLDALYLKGLSIHIGEAALPDLDRLQHLAVGTAHGWPADTSWAIVPGVYVKRTRTIGVSCLPEKRSATISVMLHEVGHAVGHLLGLETHPATRSAHIDAYPQLYPYLQGGAEGSSRGCTEFLAESFALLICGELGKIDALAGPGFTSWLSSSVL